MENAQPPEKPRNKGWVKPGEVRNPKGRQPAGLQSFKDRLARWVETKTIGEITKIVKHKKGWNKLVAADAMVARGLYDACEGNYSAMAIVLDRLLGKAPQAITGEDGKPLIPTIDVNELARRAAFLLAQASTQEPIPLESIPAGEKIPEGG